MKRLSLSFAALVLIAAPSLAATYKNSTYQAVTQSRVVRLQPQDGTGTPRTAKQVYVTVTRLDGAGLAQGDVPRAGGFAAKVGCQGGKVLSVIIAGRQAASADFEVLCLEG